MIKRKVGRPKKRESIYSPGVLFPTFGEAKTRLFDNIPYSQGAYSDKKTIDDYEKTVLIPSNLDYKITNTKRKYQVWIRE